MSSKKKPISPLGIATLIVVVLAISLISVSGFYTDWLWHQQLGFSAVFTTRFTAEIVTFVIAAVGMGLVSALSISLAYKFRPIYVQVVEDRFGLSQYRELLTSLRKAITIVVPVLLAIFAGVATGAFWQTALTFLNRVPAKVEDPQFHLDVTFYMFELPFYHSVLSYLSITALVALVLALLFNLVFGSIRLSQNAVSFSKAARVQVAVSATIFIALQAAGLWLSQYDTMTSASGLYTGATYSDVNAKIPGLQIMAAIGVVVAILFLITAFVAKWRLPIMATGLMIVSSLVLGGLYPWAVQTFQVVPNERTLEGEFIKRNLEATRAAYGLDGVTKIDYQAATAAELGALKEDAKTTAQIRIIDPALVSASFKQLEQYRQYYNFGNHLDVDRYSIDGKSQDTVIAARELNQSGLGTSQSWYNNVIVYTHGYGVVAAYGNQRSADGQPVFFQSGIPSTGALGAYEPRIYFGETSPQYSIVGGTSKALELDYPAGAGDAQQTYTTFNGNGGPKLDSLVNRLAYALKFQSEQILLSDAINNKSQILYDRNPIDRVAAAAPYLTLDKDTYPAVVDGKVVWIVDGYTTSNAYPYSRAENLSAALSDSSTTDQVSRRSINYIRNSVKATVDAYDGSVKLYAWDDKDPILKTWMKVFPGTVQPYSKMSGALMSHVRYPADLFKVQRGILGSYHVTEAGAFYSQQDAWMTPNDPTGSTSSVQKLQPPYYLSLQTPDQTAPAFSIYSTFIPRSTGASSRNVLTGYFVADSDAGAQDGVKASTYGQLRLLVLPRDSVVPGPGQVQNNFNSDSDVSKLLNILRQGSTKVLNGNLLTLPVGGGLLYVQPVYIQSTGETSFPLLKKVLVAFGDKIAFEDTLDAALDNLFGGNSGAAAGDGSSGSGGSSTGGSTSASSGNKALDAALNAAKQALADKAKAMKAGDWNSYGKADAALNAAIDAAIKASSSK
ncbi:MAG: hypothetical protein RL556_613 [Actinomycetota bacterium]|jgi:uncharacterized membrane protein (UPF0182 family)